MNRAIVLALCLYAALGAGLLALSGWMLYLVVAHKQAEAGPMLTAFMTAFALVTSKMGSCVRALNDQDIPDDDTLELRDEVQP